MIITLKYTGKCVECGHTVDKGDHAHFHRRHRRSPGYIVCVCCKPTKELVHRRHMADEQKAWNYSMAKSRACPTCGTENALTQWQIDNGYHCTACTRAAGAE